MFAIEATDTDGRVIRFPSLAAARAAGHEPRRIRDVLAGRFKQHHKLKWQRIEGAARLPDYISDRCSSMKGATVYLRHLFPRFKDWLPVGESCSFDQFIAKLSQLSTVFFDPRGRGNDMLLHTYWKPEYDPSEECPH